MSNHEDEYRLFYFSKGYSAFALLDSLSRNEDPYYYDLGIQK